MRDLCFKLDASNSHFLLINEQDNDMPDILKSAIVILFFSQIQSMRFFNGEGLYGIIAQATSGSGDYLQSNLSLISTDLRKILAKTYPEVLQVSLSYRLEQSFIYIDIDITTDKETINEVIFKQQL